MEEIRADRYKNMLLNGRLEITELCNKVQKFCAEALGDFFCSLQTAASMQSREGTYIGT